MTATGAEQLLPVTEVRRNGREVRHERLSGRVRALRSRARSGGDRDRLLLVVGGVLVPLGLLLVVLGWVGASRTVLVFEQLPYIASGGLLGLGLIVAGGFVYWSYWQTLLVREARADRDELRASFGRLESLLERALEGQLPGAAPGDSAAPLVRTRRGTMLHRADCSVVAGREDLRPATAQTPGLSACRLCDPLAD